MEISVISDQFRDFALDKRVYSSLYRYLSSKIAEDDELLEIAAHVKEGQPVPNLFLSAVQYLLLKGEEHP